MNNKYGCGCDQGFVPVSGNWDFNMDGGACQRQNRSNTCEAETPRKCACQADTRERVECREEMCSACGKARSACTCNQQPCARPDRCEDRTAPACVMKTAESARGGKKGVGIVRVTKQALNDIYDNARALKAGTLFPELHKPMNGYCPCGAACGTDCQQAAFAAWEVRLYLDTHPDDPQARALLQQLTGDCCEPNYATTFLTEGCARWAWTDDPWPWNIDANHCK